MNIQVYPHRIILNKTNEVNTGEYNVNECTFEFSQEYEGLTKVAVFSLCDGTTKNVTILNNQCIIPVECLQETGQVQIGVYGYATQDNELVLRYSPTPQNFVVRLGSYKEGTQPVAPTPTDWEILVEQVNDIAEDVSSIHEDITGINGEISGINIDIRDLQDTKANINDLAAVAFTGEFSDLKNIPSYATTQQLNQEIQDRQDADVNLQSQIDAISVSSDVVDVVGTYQELLDYDTTHLKDNDIVKVLKDSTHSNALSYYRWDKETSTWSYVGSEGPFYTKSETDALLNDKQDVIDIDNMLSSDLVDDTNSTNKFVTQADINNWNNKEDKSNKVTEINSSSTDTQYPSAKCVYDSQEEQNEHIAELEMLYNAFPTVSDEDTTIQLDNTAKVKFREIDLKGNTSQVVIPEEQGTSVSNTSIYVSDVNTDKENTIEMSGNTYQDSTTGKNLLYLDSQYDYGQNGVSGAYNETNGSFTISGKATSSNSQLTKTIPLELEAGTYTFSIDHALPKVIYMHVYYTDSTYSNINIDAGNTSATITTTKAIRTYNIRFATTADTTYNEKVYMQLESGSTATSFEKFTYGASPNPTYPQDIEVVTGTQNVEVCGKNFIPTNINQWESGQYNISGSKQTMASRIRLKDLLPITPNTIYYANTFDTTGFSLIHTYFIRECDKNGAVINNLGTINNQETFTTGNDTYYLMVTIGTASTQSGETFTDYETYFSNGKLKPFICLNTTSDKTYEAYQGTTYPINLGNIELCKIDTYKDRIYKKNDKWYLEKKIERTIFNNIQVLAINGTASGATQTSANGAYSILKNSISSYVENNTMYCNYAKYEYNSIITDNKKAQDNLNDNTFCMRQGTNDRIYFKNSSFTNKTGDEISTELNNKKLYYIRTTPITTEITDTTLVNQLNALYNATIYPITNINTDTDNLLPYIDLHYNFVTPSPSPSRPSVVNVVKGNNTITISNSDNTESQSYPINLGDMELCKINTYQDYIYESNGNWFKKENIKVATDIVGSTSKTISDMVSNATVYSYCGGTVSGTTITYTSELLVENKIYYPTTTPTDTQITDTTLITQLNNIKKAYSYDTQTNISQTNTDKPFIIYAEAIRSLKDVFE